MSPHPCYCACHYTGIGASPPCRDCCRKPSSKKEKCDGSCHPYALIQHQLGDALDKWTCICPCHKEKEEDCKVCHDTHFVDGKICTICVSEPYKTSKEKEEVRRWHKPWCEFFRNDKKCDCGHPPLNEEKEDWREIRKNLLDKCERHPALTADCLDSAYLYGLEIKEKGQDRGQDWREQFDEIIAEWKDRSYAEGEKAALERVREIVEHERDVYDDDVDFRNDKYHIEGGNKVVDTILAALKDL